VTAPGEADVPGGEVVVYQAPNGEVRVEVRLARETIWLSQRQMAELFDTSTDNVGLHLKNVFAEGELAEAATTEDYSVVQTEGRRQVRRKLKHYNLDAILSVGYRVNSLRGTQFRIWATNTLRSHLLRGFTLNERRLAERGLGEAEQAVALLARTLTTHALVTNEGQAVLRLRRGRAGRAAARRASIRRCPPRGWRTPSASSRAELRSVARIGLASSDGPKDCARRGATIRTMVSPNVVADRGPWLLDPELVFLNHGSFGSCPRPVLARQHELREELERSPVRFLGREIMERLDAVRAVLAPFVGASFDAVAFVSNATSGVNAVLRSLELAPGDELVFTDQGYNACNNAVRFVAERSGAVPVVAKLPFPLSSAEEVVEAVLAAVTDRTRLVLVDHVTSATGLVLPIERIVRALRERGVETLVDGAHALGMLPLDLDRLGAAYYTANAHKWLCAPKGAAFLHVRADLRESVRPAVISHGANAVVPGRSRFQLEFDWCGTLDPTPWLCIPAAMEFLRGLLPGGWSGLRAHNRDLALRARALLCDALGIEAPAPDEMIGSLAAVPLPSAPEDGRARSAFDVDPLQVRLWDEHRIEVPVSSWGSPPSRTLRVSAQAYNRIEEYELLAGVLRTQ